MYVSNNLLPPIFDSNFFVMFVYVLCIIVLIPLTFQNLLQQIKRTRKSGTTKTRSPCTHFMVYIYVWLLYLTSDVCGVSTVCYLFR